MYHLKSMMYSQWVLVVMVSVMGGVMDWSLQNL